MIRRFTGRLLIGIGFALVLSGCGALLPRPTQTPVFIYVTATPDNASVPTPASTSVVGPTEDPAVAALLTLPTATVTPTGTQAGVVNLPTIAPGTATALPSQRPTLTPSFTLTFTESPVPSGTAVKCTGTAAQGGFAAILTKDKGLQRTLGCAVSPAAAIDSAAQPFENGLMVWASQPTRSIYALYNNGTYQRYDDTWVEKVDPETTGETAPAGKLTPIRGFGKVWHNNPAVKAGLGWATGNESGTPGTIQKFEHGEMLFVATTGKTFILVTGATPIWRADATPF